MRRIVFAAIAAAVLSPGMIARADDINVRVNGERVDFYGAQPREIDGRVMVPLRGVLERMGADVRWDSANQTVIASRSGMDLTLPIGSHNATINGREVDLDVPAMTIGGYTMVPLRFVSEALGANVVWMSTTRTALIETNGRFRAYRRPEYRQRQNYDSPRQDNPVETRPYRRRFVVEEGCVVPSTLDMRLSSRDNAPGDRFTATIESGRDDCGLPSGTKFEGVITDAIPARGGKPGLLQLDFRRIILPDGATQSIQASTFSMDNKYVTRNESGRLVARRRDNNEQMKWVGIGAGAGLLLGTLTKGNALLDTILGGGAGYLYGQLQNKGAHNVELGSGTEVGVRIDQRVAFVDPNR